MRRLGLVAALMLLPAFTGAQRNAPGRTEAPLIISAIAKDLPCAGKPDLFSNGMVDRCRFTSGHRIGEHLIPAGSIAYFSPSGGLERVVLGREAAFCGQSLPAKATLFFGGGGELRDFWVHEKVKIQGFMLDDLEEGFGHRLRPDGKLHVVRLAEEAVVDGVPCATTLPLFRGWWHSIRLGGKSAVWFHPSGRLQQCMLARDATVASERFKRGDVVLLHDDGSLDKESPKLDWKPWPQLK